jgi:hypothetical protein
MNSRLKRFQATGLALLMLLQCLFAAAQTPVSRIRKVFTDYGLESEMRVPSRIMRRTISGVRPGTRVPTIRRSPLIFNEAGGIMFDAPAQPCAGLAQAQLRLSYDRAQPNGRRLTLRAGARAYTVAGISDSDLRPIAEFADDNVPVLTNLQYPDESIRHSCPLPSSSLRIVTLHPAFLDTHLGRLLTSMDSIPWSFSEGKRWDSQAALPPATASLSQSLGLALEADTAAYLKDRAGVRSRLVNAGESILKNLPADERRRYVSILEGDSLSEFDWESYEAKVLTDPNIDKEALGRLSVEDRRILLLMLESIGDKRVSNINDDEAPPSFCTEASTVKLGGAPRLEFIATWYVDTYPLPSSSRLMTENLPQLRLMDQEAYDGMMKIYRLGGLFRYVKRQSPFLWKQFLRGLPHKQKADTYTIICPACKKSEVEAWLSCVEKNFPSAD